jgi:hypothetical protein
MAARSRMIREPKRLQDLQDHVPDRPESSKSAPHTMMPGQTVATIPLLASPNHSRTPVSARKWTNMQVCRNKLNSACRRFVNVCATSNVTHKKWAFPPVMSDTRDEIQKELSPAMCATAHAHFHAVQASVTLYKVAGAGGEWETMKPHGAVRAALPSSIHERATEPQSS